MYNQPEAVAKNPAGYLRRAIEENFSPPKGYQSPEQRAAEEAERQRLQEAAEADRQAEAQRQQLARESVEQEPSEHYPEPSLPGSELTTESTWHKALQLISERQWVTKTAFETWLRDTRLLSVEGEVAYIGCANSWICQQVERQLYGTLVQALSEALGRTLEAEFVALDQAEALPKSA